MAQRPQGCKCKMMSADGYVLEAANKSVYSLVVGYKGATAGDIIMLRDGGPAGTVLVWAVVPAANGTFTVDLGRYGVNFTNDIYYSEIATAAGKIRASVVYD